MLLIDMSYTLHAAPQAWLLIVTVAALAAVPILVRGFRRRGTGVVYEHSFVTQNLPQIMLIIGALVMAAAFKAAMFQVDGGQSGIFDRVLARFPTLARLLSVADLLPPHYAGGVAWLGLVLSASGLVFVVGGWYSLGRHFSPNVEIFNDHAVHDGGLFRVVMHPAYSGFIQFFTGGALVVLSPLMLVLTLGVGLPLVLHRARREEIMLMERFGSRYTEFARNRRWRRIVPAFFPFGF
jgi:protein-S-isoprenylcysteine O-methyltransferase Ste14